MAEGKKRLSLEISSKEAKTGAEEISRILSGLSKQADDLTKQFKAIGDMKKTSGSGSNSNDTTKQLKEAKTATDALVKSNKDLYEVSNNSLKVYHQSNAVMKDAIKNEGALAVAMANRSKEALEAYEVRRKEQLLTQSEQKSIDERIKSELGLVQAKKESLTASQRQEKALQDAIERNNQANRVTQDSLALQRAQATTNSQLVRSQYQLTDSYKAQAEQIIKNRLDRQAYEKALVDSYSREIGLTQEVSAAQRTNEELTRKQARAEEMLKAAQDGRLESMLRAQRESELATKSVRASVNAMSEEEKQAKALNAAMTKLENTRRAEAARTEALATSTGKESVRVQELRRVQEELARSTERLNLLRTEQGKRLVQQRVEAEMLTRAYREELLGSERLTHSFSNMTSAVSALSTAMAGMLVYFSVAGLARTADAYTNITNRLAAVSGGTIDVTDATRDLLQVSIESRSTLESVMDIQSQMIRVNERLGKSQAEVADLTEVVTKAVAMSGASVQGAQGAIMQFSQAMAGDWKTAAQELNSIIEQTPALARYMAQGLREVTGDASITTATLKRLAEDGGISTELMFQALIEVLPKVREEFELTSQTTASAMQNLTDSFTLALGELDESWQVTDRFVKFTTDLAKQLPDLDKEIKAITISMASFVAVFLAIGAGALLASLGAVGALLLGVSTGAAALAGGISYLVSDMYAFEDAADAQEKKLQDLKEGTDRWREAMESARSAQVFEGLAQQEVDIAQQEQILLQASTDLYNKQQELEKAKTISVDYANRVRAEIADIQRAYEAAQEIMKFLMTRNNETAQPLIDASLNRESEEALSRLQKKLVEVTGGYDGLTKITKDYEKVVANITATYDKEIKNIEGVNDADLKRQRTNEANLTLQVALEKAESDRNKALDDYYAKANRADKRAQDRLARYAEETANLREQANALHLGGKALEEYNAKQQALKGLSSKDVTKLLPEEIKLYEERYQVILKNNQAQQDANFAKSSKDIDEEREALAKGSKAYQEYLIRKQAIQAIGGIVTSEDLKMVDELTDKIKKLNQDRFQEQATTNFDNYMEEYEARKKGEEELQALMQKRQALQILGAKSEAQLVGDAKNQYDELIKVLKEIADQDVFSKNLSSIEQGISSFQQLANTVGEGSQEMQVALDAVNAIQAVGAVLNQGLSSNPYTAFAQMAAMASTVASLGYSVGALHGDGTNIAADRQASQGTGTVLGDLNAKSESISNAVEYSADALEDILGVNSGMLAELKNLNRAMSGAANLIARDVDYTGIATGLGISAGGSTIQSLSADAGKMFDALFLDLTGGLFESLLGGIGGFVGGGLFGKSSVRDDGIRILGGTISDIIENDVVQAYQTVHKSSWFGSSTSEHYRAVSDAVETQFDLVFQSLYNTVEQAAVGLGYNQSEIQDRLDRFVVESLRISLRDLSPEDQAAELNAVFSSVFDQLATSVVPLMQEFQNAGEGMGETLSRVSTNFQVFNEGIRQLDLQKLEGTPDSILRISESFIGLFESAGDAVGAYTGFVDTFATDERKFEILSESLTRALGDQDKAILNSRNGVYDYIKTVQESGENEVERIANIVKLTDSLDEYFSLLEDVTESVEVYTGLEDRLRTARGQGDLQTRINRERELAQAVSATSKMYLEAIYAAEDLTTALDLADKLDVYSGSITATTQTLNLANNALQALGLTGMTYSNALKELEKSDGEDLVIMADNLGISMSKLGQYIESLKQASDTVTNDPNESVVENARNRVNSLETTINNLSEEFFNGVIPSVEEISNRIAEISEETNNNLPDYDALLDPYSEIVSRIESVAGKRIENLSTIAEEVEDTLYGASELDEAYFKAVADYYGASTDQIIDASILQDEALKEINDYSNKMRGRDLLTTELEAWINDLTSGYTVDDIKGWIADAEETQIYKSFKEIRKLLDSVGVVEANSDISDLNKLKSALSNLPAAQVALQDALSELATSSEDSVDSVNDLSEAISRRESLERSILELQGDTQEIRNRELEALREIYGWQENRLVALQEELWLLQDFESIVGTVRDALNLDVISNSDAISNLSEFGNTVDEILNSVANLSQADLASYLSDTGYSVEFVVSNLETLIESLDDTSESLEELAKNQADEALAALKRSIDAQKELLKTEYDNQSEIIKSSIDSVTDSVSNLENAANSLKGAIESISDQTQGLTLRRVLGAQSNLASMISSGGVTDQDLLDRSISVLSNDTRSLFGTSLDYMRSQAISLDSLKNLKGINEDSLTVEEQTLKNLKDQLQLLEDNYNLDVRSLEETYSFYEEQINALSGIDTSVLSVEQAVLGVQSAISGLSSLVLTTDTTSNQPISEVIDPYAGLSPIMRQVMAARDAQNAIDGSHANGLDNVPFDGYRAELHKGEMVLTAPIASAVRDMASNSSNAEVVSLLKEILMTVRQDSFNTNKKLIKLGDMYDIIDKWDVQGMPSDRGF